MQERAKAKKARQKARQKAMQKQQSDGSAHHPEESLGATGATPKVGRLWCSWLAELLLHSKLCPYKP